MRKENIKDMERKEERSTVPKMTGSMSPKLTWTPPKKYESPKLVRLSASNNMKDLECLAGSGGSCAWK